MQAFFFLFFFLKFILFVKKLGANGVGVGEIHSFDGVAMSE